MGWTLCCLQHQIHFKYMFTYSTVIQYLNENICLNEKNYLAKLCFNNENQLRLKHEIAMLSL